MNRLFSSAVCATAVLLSAVSVDAVMNAASAQVEVSLSFDTFHDQLAPYGDWVYSDRWGEVWIPANVPSDFHPYGTGGHWAYTADYGWTWVSDYEWGDIPFHYGRWVNDPDAGWLWIPGYVWSPGWVVWRSNGQYTGWMPMPPDEAFLNGSATGGIGVSINFNSTSNYYGYSRWYGSGYSESNFAANWVFVGTGHLADADYTRVEAPRDSYAAIIHTTTNITNYTIVNNFVVNKSVDVHVVERASGHPITAVAATAVFRKPQFITRADTGREIQARMRREIPRGTGLAGSAPKPSTKVVQSLSTNVVTRNGKQPTHLFTRNTVAKAPLSTAPAAPEPRNTAPTATASGQGGTGRAGERRIESTNRTTPNVPANGSGADETRARTKPAGMTAPTTDEMKRDDHRPAGVNSPNTSSTPPAQEDRTDRNRGSVTAPAGEASTLPEHQDRLPATTSRHAPATSTSPATGTPTTLQRNHLQHKTMPAIAPNKSSGGQTKDKDKKPKHAELPAPH